MDEDAKHLTIAEAAKLLRLSVKTLYHYVELRLIPHLRLRQNRLLFDRQQLDEWLQNKLVRPVR